MGEPKLTPDQLLSEEVANYYADPLGFVMFAYPWGEKGTQLEKFDGPDKWQREFLEGVGRAVKKRRFDGRNPVKSIREATASGHGIGKSALVAWLVNWIMSTRPHAQGTITANTATQLADKTWAQVGKWTKMCVTRHWFTLTTGKGSMKLYHNGHRDSWFCSAITCKEENSEAFAGQHAVDSTPFYIFDEASAVPDKIWEVAEGGLTDGQPMFFAFGNPTKSTGKFYRITFGSERNIWNHRSIDSRTCMLPNKEEQQGWIDFYGEDSDFVRVRVLGKPPRASDLQFIDSERVYAAQKREPVAGLDDPLIVGVDIARGGSDNNVIRFRRGLDAKTIPAIRIPGEFTRDSMKMVAKIVDVITGGYRDLRPDAVFVDASGIGGPIADRVRELGYNVFQVGFGERAPDRAYANMRAYMWGKMKDWLLHGSIDASEQLETDLTGPEYTHNNKDQVLLEKKEHMKDRGLNSPDDGDALALTFAMPVARRRRGQDGTTETMVSEYDPYKE